MLMNCDQSDVMAKMMSRQNAGIVTMKTNRDLYCICFVVLKTSIGIPPGIDHQKKFYPQVQSTHQLLNHLLSR